MPDLRKFCACGDELVARNLTPAQMAEELDRWEHGHNKPGCHPVTVKSARKARQQNFLDEIFGKEDK